MEGRDQAPNGRGRLQDKVALVTGAARGQGEVMARVFAAEGARVVLADVLDARGRAVADDIGPPAAYRHLDVRQEAEWQEVVAWCSAQVGDPTVLVNNAGIIRPAPLEETTLEDFRAVVEVNQVGCFLGMRAVIPAMRRAGGGSIVNTSSVAGLHGVPGALAYGATKFAVRGMTKTAAMELGRDGIRVNSVHPGSIDTPMISGEEFAHVDRAAYFAGIPAGRIGVPADVVMLAVFLASDESSYCTGSEFVVDGGSSAGNRT